MAAVKTHTDARKPSGANDPGRSAGPERAVAVRVLELDDELGSALDSEQRAFATRHAVAPAYWLEPGPWRLSWPAEPGGLGALVLEGAIVIRLETGGRAHLELLGAGDVINPSLDPRDDLTASVQPRLSAELLSSTRIALLDRRFALLTARWPEINARLMHKLIVRARRLSLQAAINSLPRIDERLELTLWHLSERFGYVTPKGVGLRLPLKHVQLSEMVAAQRPSVSTALARLEQQGRLARLARGSWLLCGPPPSELAPLMRQTGP